MLSLDKKAANDKVIPNTKTKLKFKVNLTIKTNVIRKIKTY